VKLTTNPSSDNELNSLKHSKKKEKDIPVTLAHMVASG
jgi:hypothetical protein